MNTWTNCYLCIAVVVCSGCAETAWKLCSKDTDLRCPSGMTCTPDGDACIPEGPGCGDGMVDEGEECDDGNWSPGDGCDAECRYEQECLNGMPEGNEQCDDGKETAECDEDCTTAECGDGRVNRAAGEVCDAGEETGACDEDCTPRRCGDGLVNQTAGEACDDGNTESGDGCSPDCTWECGDDEILWKGVEHCDDGNRDDGDGCSSGCRLEEFMTLKVEELRAGSVLLPRDGPGDIDRNDLRWWRLSDDCSMRSVGIHHYEAVKLVNDTNRVQTVSVKDVSTDDDLFLHHYVGIPDDAMAGRDGSVLNPLSDEGCRLGDDDAIQFDMAAGETAYLILSNEDAGQFVMGYRVVVTTCGEGDCGR